MDFPALYKGIADLRRHARAEGYPAPARLTRKRKASIRAIVSAAQDAAVTRADVMAAFLATDIWETAGRIVPVYETLARNAASASRRLEAAWRKGRLRGVKHKYWTRDANGDYWIGRGMVQLTHRSNFAGPARAACRKQFGIDILDDPEAVMRPDVAAFILVQGMLRGWFTRHRLTRYYDSRRALDYKSARKTVNPRDRHSFEPFKRLAERLERTLRAAGMDGPRPAISQRAGSSERLRRIQTRLKELGYHEVGTVDGILGPRTMAAVLAFKNEHGLPLTTEIGDNLLVALEAASPRQSAPARANATAADLAQMGSTDIARANTGMQTGALVAGGAGIVGAAKEVLPIIKDQSGTMGDAIRLAGEFATFIETHSLVFAGTAGVVIAWAAWRARRNRVIKHRTGEYLSR